MKKIIKGLPKLVLIFVLVILAACGPLTPMPGTPTETSTRAPTFTTQPSTTASASPTRTAVTRATSTETMTPFPFEVNMVFVNNLPSISGIKFEDVGCDEEKQALLIIVPTDHSNMVSTCAPFTDDGFNRQISLSNKPGYPLDKAGLAQRFEGDWGGYTAGMILKMPTSPTGKFQVTGSVDDSATLYFINEAGATIDYIEWQMGNNPARVVSSATYVVGLFEDMGGANSFEIEVGPWIELQR